MLSRYETISVFASGAIGKNVNLHTLLCGDVQLLI